MATVIDTLVYQFGFQTDRRGLREAERGVDRFSQRVNRVVAGVGRGFTALTTAAIGVGTAAFVTGSPVERQLLRLQTQLGLTKDEVEAITPAIRRVSDDTKRPLDQVAAAYFNARSAGLDHAAALDTITASARASAGQLGTVDNITKLVSATFNSYGAAVGNATRLTDILNNTVKEGSLEAAQLPRALAPLLQLAPPLGVSFAELNAVIAGVTRTGATATVAGTQLQQVLFGLLRPTATATKALQAYGISTTDLQERLREDGLINTLQWLWRTTGENQEAFTRLFESQEAVLLAMDLSGKRADEYRQILANVESGVGSTDAAFQAWSETGFSKVEGATNDLKLRLTDLYDRAVVPLLTKFGELPEPIQTAALVMGGLAGASALLGGPSAFGALRLILFPVIALFGLLSIKFILIGALIAGLVIGIKWLVENWDTAVAWLRDIWDRFSSWFGEQMERFGTLTREQWDRLTSWIGEQFDKLGTTLRETWDRFTGWFGEQVGATTIVEKWDRFTAWMGEQFEKLGTALRETWDRFTGWFGERFAEVGPVIEDALLGVIDWVTNDLPMMLREGFTSFVDWITNDLGPMLGDAARTALDWILFQFEGLGDRLQQEFSDTPVLGGLLQAATFVGGGVRNVAENLPGFARGGVVPGARGRAQLAMVHGGEMVLPDAVADTLLRFAQGPPPGPAGAYAGAAAGTTINAPITVGEIIVNAAPGQSPREIAREVRRELLKPLRDEIESRVAAVDSDVLV